MVIVHWHCVSSFVMQYTCKLVNYCTLYLNSTKQLKQLHQTGKDDKAAQKLHIWGLKRKHLEVRKNAIAMCILQGVKKKQVSCRSQWMAMKRDAHNCHNIFKIWHIAQSTLDKSLCLLFPCNFSFAIEARKKKKFCKVNKYSQTPVLQYCLVNHMRKKKKQGAYEQFLNFTAWMTVTAQFFFAP